MAEALSDEGSNFFSWAMIYYAFDMGPDIAVPANLMDIRPNNDEIEESGFIASCCLYKIVRNVMVRS